MTPPRPGVRHWRIKPYDETHRHVAAAAVTLGAATALLAAEIDLSGFDTLLMQDMDATVKDLEPLIGARNSAEATEAVVFLEQGLEWTEQYSIERRRRRREARPRRQAARAGRRAALAADDFGAAAAAARDVAKSCRACHDVYRP